MNGMKCRIKLSYNICCLAHNTDEASAEQLINASSEMKEMLFGFADQTRNAWLFYQLARKNLGY